MDILKELNDNQRIAVETTEGYVRVSACPGSGKTKVLVSRYIYLTEELGVPDDNILCVSFTNKATREIRNRIRKIRGKSFDTKFITTYHGFCLKVLRENMNFFHYPKNVNILDYEDQKSLLKEVYKELGIKANQNSYRGLLGEISKFKSEYVDFIVEYMSEPDSSKLPELKMKFKDEKIKDIIKAYIDKQRQTYYLDYDDIINFTYYLFKNNERVLSEYQDVIQYCMIDEFQDTDKIQKDIALMVTAKNRNLFVVGDDDQSIYSWRGAYPEFFVNLKEHIPSCTDIVLGQNYRSTKKIVSLGNELIKHNKVRVSKDMFTENIDGENIIYYHANDDYNEADWVSNNIKSLGDKGVSFNDIAVLYRSNYQSGILEKSLVKNQIGYSIWGGTKFFEREEIKDMISYLKLIFSSDDNIAFKRIVNKPRRKMGDKKIAFIENEAELSGLSMYDTLKSNVGHKTLKGAKIQEFIDVIEYCRNNNLTPSASISYVLDKTGYEAGLREDAEEDRLENLAELVRFTKDFETSEDTLTGTLEEYLEYISLYTDKSDDVNPEGAIKMLTMHTSKGLEFDYVFIIGLGEGIVPSQKSVSEKGEAGLEEERRLFYVGITRAKKGLYLSYADGFFHDGKEKNESRFIKELGDRNIEFTGISKGKSRVSALTYNRNVNYDNNFGNVDKSFKEGDLVEHKVFGRGIVAQVDLDGASYVVNFNNDRIKGSRIISMRYKGITRI